MLTCPSNLRLHMAAHVDRLSAHLDDISLVNVWINELISPGITSAADRFVSLMSLQHFLTDLLYPCPGGVMVTALNLRLKRSRVRILAVPLSGNNLGQFCSHTCASVTKQ